MKKPALDWLTIPRLLVFILFIAIFTMAVRIPTDTDSWWHLRSGQYIVEQVTIPTTDPFSHTQAGQPWIDHGWLAQVLWYGLYALGGAAALSLGLAALVTAAFWFAWRQVEGNLFVTAFSLVLGAIVSSVVWAARPQMVSFLLTGVVAYLLHRFKRHEGRLLPWLPLVMLVWVNMHAGFAIGFMLGLAYLAGEVTNHLARHEEDRVVSWGRLGHLLLALGLSLAVVVINPHTWRMWLYPFQTVGIGALRDFIQEWQSPNFHLAHMQPFALMLLLVLAALGRAGRRADWTDQALVAMWTAWALFAARNVAIFGLVVAPILARYAGLAWTAQWQTWGYERVPFSAAPDRVRRRQARLNWLLLLLLAAAALVRVGYTLATTPQGWQAGLPTEAVAFIEQEQPPGPMFNSYNWGGYLIFELWPAYPVYIDGRTDLYNDTFIRRYLNVMVAGEGWQQTLDRDGINLVFVESNSILARFMERSPAWSEIYRDELAVLFARTSTLP